MNNKELGIYFPTKSTINFAQNPIVTLLFILFTLECQ